MLKGILKPVWLSSVGSGANKNTYKGISKSRVVLATTETVLQ